MKFYRGTVKSSKDVTKSGTISVNLPISDDPVFVTYVSPYSNVDSGLFAPPTETAEVLVLQIEVDDDKGDSAGFYYLGSPLDGKRNLSAFVKDSELFRNTTANPEVAKNTPLPYPSVKHKSLGRDVDFPGPHPDSADDAYEADGVNPQVVTLQAPDKANITFKNQTRPDPDQGYQNIYSKLESSKGKYMKLIDSPNVNAIKISPMKPSDKEGQDVITFAGTQPESGTIADGEFRVDTKGPINHTSRGGGQNITVQEGRNIILKNNASGQKSKDPQGRRLVRSGGDEGPYWDVGAEDWGCVKLISKYNNIVIDAQFQDSVIYLKAPGLNSKVVVDTSGTVDVIAKKKITLSSLERIELKAPYININSGIRTDID